MDGPALNHPLGQVYSLASALCWGMAVVLFKRSGERLPPIGLNLLKNAVAILLLVATLPLAAAWDDGHAAAKLAQFTAQEFVILALSGIVGIAIADTLFFYALNLIGVGLISIVDCCYSPAVLLFAWLLLSETLSEPHYVGGALILAGVFIAFRHRPPAGRTRGQLATGILLAIVAISSMALAIVVAKPIVERMALLWATLVRILAGTAALAIPLLLRDLARRRWSLLWSVYRPSSVWLVAVPGAILGTYLSLVAWMAGFKYTYASVAAVLNQTSVIFAIILASIFLKEPFSTRKLVAVVLGLDGVMVIQFADAALARQHRPLVLAIAAISALVPLVYYFGWRRTARQRERWMQTGRCPDCGSPRTGPPEPRCPECGHVIVTNTDAAGAPF